MKASISFREIEDLLADKIKNGSLRLSCIDGQTIGATYRLLFPITIELRIKQITNTDLYLDYGGGIGVPTVIKGLLQMVKNQPKLGFIESLNDNGVVLHLDQIEQVQQVLDAIEIQALCVKEDGIEAEGKLKA